MIDTEKYYMQIKFVDVSAAAAETREAARAPALNSAPVAVFFTRCSGRFTRSVGTPGR